MKFITAFILFVFFNSFSLFSQHIELLVQEGKTSIRGISVVSEKIIWVSGSQGKFAKSLDGGKTWDWETVPKFETRDFRDIEAFDGNTAILMAVSEPAIILKTIDGGKNWKLVFIDSTKGMFLDAMYFANNKSGIVIGDPIDANVFLARTTDQGTTWMRIKSFGTKQMAEGEAFFAASGTNIMMLPGGNQHPVIWASGGRKSRLWHFEQTLTADSLPIIQGKESTGANSLDMYDERHGIVVGGDFANDKVDSNNCVLFELTGAETIQFIKPHTTPHGYRSCVAYLTKERLVSCGTSGVDYSEDGGANWKLISTESYHTCQKSKYGNAIYLAGSKGKVGKLVL